MVLGLFRRKDRTPRERVEIYKAADGWRYRVKAKNNRIVGASEQSFTQFRYAVKRVQKQHASYPIFKIEEDGTLTRVAE